MRTFAGLVGMWVAASAFGQISLDTYPVDETDKTPPFELRERRQHIKALIGKDSIGVFFTNPVRNRNNDVDFEYRGDSTFLYLTGFEEPDAALILAPGGITVDGKRVTEVLFLNLPDLGSITWLGYRMGPQNAVKLLGIEAAQSNGKFTEVLNEALKNYTTVSTGPMPFGEDPPLRAMTSALNAAKNAQKFTYGANLTRPIEKMREVKSAWEIATLKKVCDISAKAHVEAMKAMKPNMREYEISALMTYNFMKNGCEYTGYPSICGSGPNSTILHYESNRRLMKSGDIYCMDSAGEFHGYSADVTRTFPVNGKYTAEQKAIYKVAYDAQEAGIQACKVGNSMGTISGIISKVLADGLIKLGIIDEPRKLGTYYMHGFGHGIGLDVHDPVSGTLVSGNCLTVEPGIYIKAGSPCDPKWWNIGVRIEDDVLVTDSGPVNMSAAAPRKWEEIERLMATKKLGS